MKKLSLLMIVAVVLSVTVLSGQTAELPYLRMVYSDANSNYMATPERDVRLCLTLSSPVESLQRKIHDYPAPLSLRFDPPANAYACEFEHYVYEYYNEAEKITYGYQLHSSYEYKEFLSRCDRDEDILFDGSMGYAAYTEDDPMYGLYRAYAIIDMKELGRSAKLTVSVSRAFSDTFPKSESREAMIALIKAEIERILETKQIDPMQNVTWAKDRYRGLKIHHAALPLLLVWDYPQNEACITFLEDIRPGYYPGSVYYYPNTDTLLQASVRMEPDLKSSSFADARERREPSKVFTEEIAGKSVKIYSDGESLVDASIELQRVDSEAWYLEIHLFGYQAFPTRTEVLEYLTEILSGISIVDLDSDPYIPGK